MKIAIVGAGKLGIMVADALLGGDHSITIIDKNEDTLPNICSLRQTDFVAILPIKMPFLF